VSSIAILYIKLFLVLRIDPPLLLLKGDAIYIDEPLSSSWVIIA